jgi:NADH:ubiquinone oxidoreductase subunit C
MKNVKNKVFLEFKNKILRGFDMREEKDDKGNIQLWTKLFDRKEITLVAEIVRELGGRCVIITAYKEKENFILVYHFDIDGMLLNVEVKLEDNKVDSITPILNSANWAEREFREMFGIEVIGHPYPNRLFLDESIEEGILGEYNIPLSKAMNGAATCILWEKIESERQRKNGN